MRSVHLPDVVELRQYTMVPGRRDELIDLFDRLFIDGLEAAGMAVLGLFRDLDRPDRFVWLRGFPDMARRHTSLEAFYGGPLWAASRGAANATMLDSDDVLLLRPVSGGVRAESSDAAGRRVTITIAHLAAAATPAQIAAVTEALAVIGAPPLAVLATEPAKNTFPRLPVREGETVLAWIGAWADDAACEQHARTAAAAPAWRAAIAALAPRRLEVLRLAPTDRSRT
jgi:quinol monooxygenase YgiN